MPKKYRRPYVGPELQAMLEDLKSSFARREHLILRVSRYYRRHSSDFLAVPKDNPRQFVLVQPTLRGQVEVRPFGCDKLYSVAKQVVKHARNAHNRKVFWGDQITPSRKNLRLKHFLTPGSEEELERIIGPVP
jgi:hypothetical protein